VHSDAVVLPVDLFTGLNPFNLSAYGLRARWPTLRVQHYCCHSQGLANRWLAKPSDVGFSPTRLHGIARSLQNRRPDPNLLCETLRLTTEHVFIDLAKVPAGIIPSAAVLHLNGVALRNASKFFRG